MLLGLLLLLAAPLVWQSLVATPHLQVDVGQWGDHTFLDGVNGVETSTTEEYRWTSERTTIHIPNLSSAYRVLVLRAHGWRPEGQEPPAVRLEASGRAFGSMQTTRELRRYHILLPASDAPETGLVIDSSGATIGGERQLGIALDWLELDQAGAAVPSLWQFGGQLVLLAGVFGVCWLLARGRWFALLPAAALALALIGSNWRWPLLAAQGLPFWLATSALLLATTILVAGPLQRALSPWMSTSQAQWALALFVGALALRLLGAAHPQFNSHDVDVHMRWLSIIDSGQLYIYSTPGELRNRQTFNPPAGYVLLLPLWLALPDSRLVAQVGVALIDGLGCLLLLPIARELRIGPRAALFAMALSVALPISMTMLWWGFATNTIAQTCWLLLLWVLLRLARTPSRALVALFVVALLLNMLMHAGALVLVVAMLVVGGALALPVLPPGSRNAALLGVALALLIAVPLYFSAAAGPLIGQASEPSQQIPLAASLAKGWADRYLRAGLVWRGMLRGFLPLLLGAMPPGVALLARGDRLRARLVATWLAVAVLFFAVYMALGLTTRYIYFIAPLVCLACGAVLAHFWRWRVGQVVVLAFIGMTTTSGVLLWLGAALLRIKPSILPLTQ